jgi:hypothetical protein
MFGGTSGSGVAFMTNNLERARIDTSGNFLMGNTVVNPASGFSNQAGFGYASTGKVEIATTANGAVMELGKNNANDGELLVFRKQGTTVGSIGADGGSMAIGGGDVGIGFYQGADALVPYNGVTAVRDNAIDLGMTSARYKDLHLSHDLKLTSGSEMYFGERGSFKHDSSTYNMSFNMNSLSNALVITGTGLVGVGTDSPNFTNGNGLEIERAGIATLRLTDTGSGGKSFELFSDDGTGYQIKGLGSAMPIIFSTVGAERMRLDQSGNLGIGGVAADPQGFGRAVHIEGATNSALYLRDTGNANYGYIGFIGGATNKMTLNSYQGYLSLTTGAGLEGVRISETGVTNIGMTATTGAATVRIGSVGNASANGTGNLEFVNSSSYKSWKISAGGTPAGTLAFTRSGSSGGDNWSTEIMRLNADGHLLVGTTDSAPHDNTSSNGISLSPSGVDVAVSGGETLYLNRMGSDGRTVNFRKAGVFVAGIDVTSSAVTYNTSSDQRLKENIQDAEDAGSKIDAIKVRQFDWKVNGTHQDYGLIAQELHTVAPEAVSGDANSEEMMGVDYSKLVPMIIKAVQEQQEQIELLTTEINNLKGE